MLLFPIHTRCAGDAGIQQYISRVPARCQGSCAGGNGRSTAGALGRKTLNPPCMGEDCVRVQQGGIGRRGGSRAGAAGGIERGKMDNGSWKIGNGEAPRGWTCPPSALRRQRESTETIGISAFSWRIHARYKFTRCSLKNLLFTQKPAVHAKTCRSRKNLPFTQKPDKKLSKLSIRFLWRYSASGVISS